MNVLEKNLVFEDCYMTKLSFFEAEVTLPVRIDHIVTKDLYCTLKLSSLDCSLCDIQIFYMRQRADLCVTCAERVIYLCQQEALYSTSIPKHPPLFIITTNKNNKPIISFIILFSKYKQYLLITFVKKFSLFIFIRCLKSYCIYITTFP